MNGADDSRPPLAPSKPSSGARLERPLRGRHLVIPGESAMDRLAALLRREGAEVTRRPALVIRDATDSSAVERWVAELVGGTIDHVVFLSEDGVDQLAQVAERLGWTPQVRAALRSIYKTVRGPKPGHALHRMGLEANLTTPPSLPALMRSLEGQGSQRGRRIGLQQFPDDPTAHLARFLENLGATVYPVAPRCEAVAGGIDELVAFVIAISRGEFDALIFSQPLQVTHLFEVCARRNLVPLLRRGLEGVAIAATDAIVAECLRGLDVAVDIVPAVRKFSLRSLTRVFVTRLGAAPTKRDLG
jgi:uroporphyrinogen-III synthase